MSKQRTLTLRDRRVLAERWAAGDGAVNIAVELGFSPAAIYQELKRGDTGELDQNKRPKYDPEKKAGSETFRRKIEASSASAALNGLAVLLREYAALVGVNPVEVLALLATVLTVPAMKEE